MKEETRICKRCKTKTDKAKLRYSTVLNGWVHTDGNNCYPRPKVIILDDNPFSIASYLEEYGDKPNSEKINK